MKKQSIPKGFQQVASGSSFPKAWQPKPGDALVGVVLKKRTLDAKKIGRTKAKKGDTALILDVADSDTGEILGVWDSFATRAAFDQAKPGDEIYIRFDGQKKIGKKRLNEYTVALKAKKGK